MKSIVSFIAGIIILSSSIQSLSAQSYLRNITLYTAAGDSITGEIFFKTTLKSFYSIAVQDKVNHTIKKYKPSEVKSFVIKTPEQTLYFRSLQVDADFSPINLAELSISPLVKLKRDQVFALLLVSGEKELYYYSDNRVLKDHYLIRTADDQVIDLINKRYYVTAARTTATYSQEYKIQLSKLLMDSPLINTERINKTEFRKSDLKKLITEYNASRNYSSYELEEEKIKREEREEREKREKEKVILRFGIVAGFNNTTLKFSGNIPDGSHLTFNKSKGVNTGLKLEFILPETKKKWSFYTEGLLSSYSFRSNEFYLYYKSKDNYEKQQYLLKATCLKIFTAMRLKFPGEMSLFIQAGIVNSFALKHTSSVEKQHVLFSPAEHSKEAYPFRSYEQSVFAGVGYQHKRIGIEFRGELGNGMSAYADIISRIKYGYVLLNYTF